VSTYRIAILQTITTIDSRARYFRNLVVTVVVLTLGSIGWAAVTWTFSPLAGLLLIFPACGVFFFLVAKLLSDWRSQLFDAWLKKDIEFRDFCEAVSAIREDRQRDLSTKDLTVRRGSRKLPEAASLPVTCRPLRTYGIYLSEWVILELTVSAYWSATIC
jgi:hypothetical protein